MSYNVIRRIPALAAAAAMAFGLAVAACEAPGGSGEGEGFLLRDSAGVALAENDLAALAGAEGGWVDGTSAWRVSEAPIVEIGVQDGPDEYQFASIVGVLRLPDGGIVVGDRSHPEGMIRFYDPEGGFVRRMGRAGDGPGEFRMLFGLWSYRGDSIAAWDLQASRLSVLDQEGELGRTLSFVIPSDDPPAPPGLRAMEGGRVVGPFRDGTFLVQPGRLVSAGGEPVEYQRRYLRSSPEMEVVDTLGPFPRAGASPTVRFPDGRRAAPFAGGTVRLVRGDRIYTGSAERYELQVYDAQGALERVIRLHGRDLAITEPLKEAYRERWLAEAGGDPGAARQLESALADFTFPETAPAYLGALVQVDSEDHLWVPQYPLAPDEGPPGWDVFDPEGGFLGTVAVPEGLQVQQVGRDFILGVWRDGMGVPYVRMYALER